MRIGSASERCTGASNPGTLLALGHEAGHQTSAPPPNEKNDRKKLDAANAIDRPKTIWIRRRDPPDVSPKASDRPVMMMTITAIDLGHRALDRLQNLVERLLPRHVRAGSLGRPGGEQGERRDGHGRQRAAQPRGGNGRTSGFSDLGEEVVAGG